MAKKPRARKPKRERKPLSAKTRAADEHLRESLRNADLQAFDRLLPKAITRIDTMATSRMSSVKRKVAGSHAGPVPGFLSLTDAEAAGVEKRVRAAGVRAKAKKS